MPREKPPALAHFTVAVSGFTPGPRLAGRPPMAPAAGCSLPDEKFKSRLSKPMSLANIKKVQTQTELLSNVRRLELQLGRFGALGLFSIQNNSFYYKHRVPVKVWAMGE